MSKTIIKTIKSPGKISKSKKLDSKNNSNIIVKSTQIKYIPQKSIYLC